MNFEQMQKIWDTQNNEAFFGYNQTALQAMILAKKNTGKHISNTSELLLILVNFCSTVVIGSVNFFNEKHNPLLYLLAAWMLCTAVYVMIKRAWRKKASLNFDRSLHGDLDHALSLTNYQVQLSALMRWNVVPLGLLVLPGIFKGGTSIWFGIALSIFFIIVFYASRWEHRLYQSRKRELEGLKKKLSGE